MEENSLLIQTSIKNKDIHSAEIEGEELGWWGGGHSHRNELIPRVMTLDGLSSLGQWGEPEVHCSTHSWWGRWERERSLKNSCGGPEETRMIPIYREYVVAFVITHKLFHELRFSSECSVDPEGKRSVDLWQEGKLVE